MPDGSLRQQVYLVPFYGPIPAHTTVVTSLQQLQQFQLPVGPTLIPSPQPQKQTSSLQIVSPQPVQFGTPQRTEEPHSGLADKVDANGTTNENEQSGESSANNPTSNPSASSVEECSKENESMVDHDSEEKNVISNVQEVPVENNETVGIPPATSEVTQQVQPPQTLPLSENSDACIEISEPSHNEEEFPQLGGARSRENSSSGTDIPRTESMHTLSESGESSQSDFSKEWTKAYVYKTLKRVRVRAGNTPTSDEVGILDKGQYVNIVFVDGRKGRIVEPLNGWVSLKKKKEKQLTQVFNNFEAPTVILRNLDSSLCKEKDVLNFLRSQGCRPTRCIWQKKDDFVTVFFTTHKDASKLVRGKYICNDTLLTAEWADGYAKTVSL